MYYVIKLICVNKDNPYKLNYGQVVWVSEVFGIEKKYSNDQSRAYQFLSLPRVQMIAQKIKKNNIFNPVIIKTY